MKERMKERNIIDEEVNCLCCTCLGKPGDCSMYETFFKLSYELRNKIFPQAMRNVELNFKLGIGIHNTTTRVHNQNIFF